MLISNRSDRRYFQRALAVSLLLHAILIALWQVPTNLTTDPATLDLRLWIDDAGDVRQDVPQSADVQRAAAPEPGVAAAPGARGEPLRESSAEPGTPTEPALSAAVAAADPVPAEPSAADEPVRDAEPESDDSVIAASDPTHAEPASAELTAREEKQLTREVTDWMRDLAQLRDKETSRSWRRGGQTYTARVEARVAATTMDHERVLVVVTTEREGQAFETRMQMKRLAFSHFTQLVDRWDRGMRLNDDEIHGRFHSNDAMVVGWTRSVAPRFFGLVTTAARSYEISADSRFRPESQIFPGGIQKHIAPINMPRLRMPLDDNLANSRLQRRFFETDTRLEFFGNGRYRWRAAFGDSPFEEDAIGTEPLYLLARPGVRLEVQGKLQGTVVVYSPSQITITGNLFYARDVRQRTDVNDYLGLVSDGDIVIAPPAVTGPGDLRIEGALYARRRFAVPEIYADFRAQLSIYGSLSAGVITETEPRYSTRLEFDPRFERLRPPSFPVTDRYEPEQWDRLWQPVPKTAD